MKTFDELDIPAASPTMYLTTLAHDLLLAEVSSRRTPGRGVGHWNRATLAYVYGQAARMFNDQPVPIGASHPDTIANAVSRLGACPFCLCAVGHYAECHQPF
jgi:hypothetical protein